MDYDQPFVNPAYNVTGFNCPHCRAYAHQNWSNTQYIVDNVFIESTELRIAHCSACRIISIWFREQIVYPVVKGTPLPNPDLNEDIRDDFEEARSIVDYSARGAAALLRLCVQKLCIQLGEKGENLNTDIGKLVEKGLSDEIQQSLDAVRVIGNNAVHPGQIDLKDDPEIATTLFSLVNVIAEDRISRPNRIKKIYEGIPESAREEIEKRDSE